MSLEYVNKKQPIAVKGTESILKKRSGRLCLRVFPFEKGIQKTWRQQQSKERSVTGTATRHSEYLLLFCHRSELM